MVGLGTIFIAMLALAAIELWRGRLFDNRGLLWMLMLTGAVPLHRQHGRLDHRRSRAGSRG